MITAGVANILFWGLLGFWLVVSNQPSNPTYIVFCTLISAIAFFVVINPWQNDIFEPIKCVSALYGISFGIGPLVLAPDGAYAFEYLGAAREELLSYGAIHAFVGFLCLLTSYYAGRSGFRKVDWCQSQELSWTEKSTLTWIGFGLLVVGATSYLMLVVLTGGFAHFFYYTGARGDIFQGVFGGFYWGAFFMVAGLCALGTAHAKKRPILIVLLGLLIGAAFAVFQGRDELLGPLCCAVVLVHYCYKKLNLKLITVVALILFILASLIGAYRVAEKKAIYKNAAGFLEGFLEAVIFHSKTTFSNNLEQMDALLIAERYVQVSGKTLNGATLVDWLTPINKHLLGNAIPSIHPGVFLDYAAISEHRWNKSHTALSPSLTGELYLNFSVTGVIIGLFFYGLLLRWVYVHFIEARHSRFLRCLYPFALWVLSKAVIDGTVLFFRLFVVTVPLAMVCWYLVLRSSQKRSVHIETQVNMRG